MKIRRTWNRNCWTCFITLYSIHWRSDRSNNYYNQWYDHMQLFSETIQSIIMVYWRMVFLYHITNEVSILIGIIYWKFIILAFNVANCSQWLLILTNCYALYQIPDAYWTWVLRFSARDVMHLCINASCLIRTGRPWGELHDIHSICWSDRNCAHCRCYIMQIERWHQLHSAPTS